jgi:hypothetical protein
MAASNNDHPLAVAASQALENLYQSAALKFLFERMFIGSFSGRGPFINSETLKTLCIDTDPERETDIQSMLKYWIPIQATKKTYIAMASIYGCAMALPPTLHLLSGDLRSAAISAGYISAANAEIITRLARGVERYHNLSTGKWAVIDMPKEQATKETPLLSPSPRYETAQPETHLVADR